MFMRQIILGIIWRQPKKEMKVFFSFKITSEIFEKNFRNSTSPVLLLSLSFMLSLVFIRQIGFKNLTNAHKQTNY